MRPLPPADLQQVQALRAELGPGDGVTAARWATLEGERTALAERLDVASGPANLHEPFRLIRAADEDATGQPSRSFGEDLVGPRWWFHLLGLRHGAAHVVLTTPQGWFVTQRRSRAKDDSPGALDVAVSGHIGTDSPEAAAWREMHEEIGIRKFGEADPPLLVDQRLMYGGWYDAEEAYDVNPPILNRERRWIFSGALTPAGLASLRFADGEVIGLHLLGPVELQEVAARCRRRERRTPGELDLAWGIIDTLPRWLDRS